MLDTVKFKVVAAIFSVMAGIILTVGVLYYLERADNKKLTEKNTELTTENTRLKEEQRLDAASDKVNEGTGLEIANEHRETQQDKETRSENLNQEFEALMAKWRAQSGDSEFAMGLDLEKLDELIKYSQAPTPVNDADDSEKALAQARSLNVTLAKEVKQSKLREEARQKRFNEVNELSLDSAWDGYCKVVPTNPYCAARNLTKVEQ